MVVHSTGHIDGTLVNALLPLIDPKAGDPQRPGIVHRLDKGTSGLLVVARTPNASTFLIEQFAARTIKEISRSGVGVPIPKGSIEAPIGRSNNNRKRAWPLSRTVDMQELTTTCWHIPKHPHQPNPMQIGNRSHPPNSCAPPFAQSSAPLRSDIWICQSTQIWAHKSSLRSGAAAASCPHTGICASHKGEMRFSIPPPDFMGGFGVAAVPFQNLSVERQTIKAGKSRPPNTWACNDYSAGHSARFVACSCPSGQVPSTQFPSSSVPLSLSSQHSHDNWTH